VTAENIIERRPEPDDAAAQVKSGDFKRKNCVVDRPVGWRSRRDLRGHHC
jgi:hypothetical protein